MSKEHLAGVIPVANIQTDFDMKIPELMLPIGPGFNLIQKSVFECALAGCNTIWIVANEDLAPIIKKVVGEGAFGKVFLVEKKDTKEFFAMKTLAKDMLLEDDRILESTLLEKKIL